MLQGNRLRWQGHVSRIKDDRIQRQLLFCELPCGTCDRGRPRKRSKDYWHKFYYNYQKSVRLPLNYKQLINIGIIALCQS